MLSSINKASSALYSLESDRRVRITGFSIRLIESRVNLREFKTDFLISLIFSLSNSSSPGFLSFPINSAHTVLISADIK
jgi:hypothetical protein